jgi:hypothetical protein
VVPGNDKNSYAVGGEFDQGFKRAMKNRRGYLAAVKHIAAVNDRVNRLVPTDIQGRTIDIEEIDPATATVDPRS